MAQHPGSGNGAGTAAQFNGPKGVAVDSSGNIYVADAQNNRIRKIPSDRGVTTLAGDGTEARFNGPSGGMAMDSSSNLYVADNGNHCIRKITTPGGVVTTFAGSDTGTPGSADTDKNIAATFRSPIGVAMDSSGNLYVADYGNHRIRKITPAGEVTTIAGSSCGLDLHVVLAGTKSEQNPASQAIFSQCDTTLHYVPEGESTLADVYSHLVESLKFKRNAVYKLHPGGSDSIGALAYIHTFHDILDFSHRTEVNFLTLSIPSARQGSRQGWYWGNVRYIRHLHSWGERIFESRCSV